MNIVFRFFLVGLAGFISSIIVTNINIFSSFENSNLYDATLVGILTMISAYFILKGMYDEK